ncbi:MAG: hypothetical protein P4L46_22870 [Fimbriimonas sp.]|nr:hypothetical protein [Fimbriimonas sp.]
MEAHEHDGVGVNQYGEYDKGKSHPTMAGNASLDPDQERDRTTQEMRSLGVTYFGKKLIQA